MTRTGWVRASPLTRLRIGGRTALWLALISACLIGDGLAAQPSNGDRWVNPPVQAWSDKDIEADIEFMFTRYIYSRVVSLQLHSIACGDLRRARDAERKLLALAARVPISMDLTIEKLRTEQDMAGVREGSLDGNFKCLPSALEDRKILADEALSRLDTVISEWERRDQSN